MSETPDTSDLYFLDSHEWHRLTEEGLIEIGVSQQAVDDLTDITYLEFSKQSGAVKAGDTFGEIESVKATSDLYCGIDGDIVAFNQEALDNPEVVNEDCYGKGWMIKVKPKDPEQIKALKDAATYGA